MFRKISILDVNGGDLVVVYVVSLADEREGTSEMVRHNME